MTFLGMADRFQFSVLGSEMFASGVCDFTTGADHPRKGKLVILDIPVLAVWAGKRRDLMQIIIKLVCQRQWLSHAYKPGCCNGAALRPETNFQTLFVEKFETHFVQICRWECHRASICHSKRA